MQINLTKLTRRFRITLEETFNHERPEIRTPDRRWYEIVPCQGFKKGPGQEGPYISLFCETPALLKLYTNRPRNARAVWEAIKSYPGTKADFGFDGEADLIFPPELLDTVAELAGGRKKRQLTEEQRTRLIEAGRAGRDALKKWREQRVQGQKSGQIEAISPAR